MNSAAASFVVLWLQNNIISFIAFKKPIFLLQVFLKYTFLNWDGHATLWKHSLLVST